MKNSVRKIRYDLQMTRQELAKALKISSAAIANYENNPKRKPDLRVAYALIELARSLGKLKTLEDVYPRASYYKVRKS